MHLNSELLFVEYAAKYFRDGQKVLEIGPCGFPSHYQKLVNKPSIHWNSLDIGTDSIAGGENNPLHVTSESEYNYPLPDNTFDVVVSGQVMEHVKDIWKWVDELKRLVKPNGLVIVIVPVSWTYHEYPVDCWRVYPDGMRALMEAKGFEIVECTFESLEKTLLPKSTPTIPGNASVNMDRVSTGRKRLAVAFNRIVHPVPLLNKLKLPLTVAYDTICVSKKSS
jgi:SAM-dependent methyltransferase